MRKLIDRGSLRTPVSCFGQGVLAPAAAVGKGRAFHSTKQWEHGRAAWLEDGALTPFPALTHL